MTEINLTMTWKEFIYNSGKLFYPIITAALPKLFNYNPTGWLTDSELFIVLLIGQTWFTYCVTSPLQRSSRRTTE